jgi:hypothetical protein
MLCDKPQDVDTRGGTAKEPKGEGRRVLTFRSIHAFKARLSPYRTSSRTSLRESALLLLSHFVGSRETGSTNCDEDPVGPRFPERVEALGPTADGESTRSDASLLSKPFCVCANEVGLSGVIVAPSSSELSPSFSWSGWTSLQLKDDFPYLPYLWPERLRLTLLLAPL